MSTENVNDQSFVERFKLLAGAESDSEAAEKLGFTPQSYHNRKVRKTLLPKILEWGVLHGADLNWIVWGGTKQGADKQEDEKTNRGRALHVADAAPSYQYDAIGLGRAVESVDKIIRKGPEQLRRALTATLHHFGEYIDELEKPAGRTLEERIEEMQGKIETLENALSTAKRRATAAEERLKAGRGM